MRRRIGRAGLAAVLAAAGFLGAPQAAKATDVGANTNLVGNDEITAGALVTNLNLTGDATVTVVPAGGAANANITLPIVLGGVLTLDANGNTSTLSGVISGANALVYTNGGAAVSVITVSGVNTYTTATTLSSTGGSTLTVAVTNAAGLGTDAAGTTIGASTTLDLQGVTVGDEDITFSGAGTLATSTGTSSLSGAIVINDNIAATVSVGGTQLTLSGVISDQGGVTAGTLAKTGAGTLVLSGANTFVGAMTISAGTVEVTNDAGLGTAAGATTLTGGTLDLQGVDVAENIVLNGGNLSTTTGTSSSSGTVALSANSTVTVSGTKLTLSGVVSGAGALTKAGSGELVLSNTANTYTGETIINAGTLTLGAAGSINSGNTVTINAGTLDLGGYNNPTLNVNLNGGTINGGTGGQGQLSGTLRSIGGTITNVTGDAVFTQTRGTTTITGANQFNGVTMNGGTIATTITGGGEVPITNTGGFDYNGGVLTVDASGVTAKTGKWTVISGSVDEALARNTEVTFQGKTLKFEGFDAPIAGYALYDLYLKKGSLQFVSDRKAATDVCGITGLCADGYLKGSLEGADKDAVAGVVRDVLMPSYEAGDLTLGFYTTQENLSKFVISGLMPRNVDAAGNSLANYNELLADTLFDRQPLRKFKTVEVVSEASAVEAVETSSGEVVVEGAEVAAASTEVTEDPSLAAQYLEDDKWGAWVKGFGGDYNNDGEGTYVYRDYSATFGGVLLGVDYEVASDLRIGGYANNGYVSMSQSSGDYSGSGSWNPTGWGGGITASYTKPNFYVQGLFGASGFSGTQKRSLVASTIAAAQTIEAEKDVTSFIGSLRFGAPVELGKFILDPQLQATWTGNQESAFNESTGGNAKLSYASRSTNFLQTELGAKLTMPINLGKKSEIVPNIRVAWLGDWGINGEGQEVGYSFTNRTATIDSENQNDMGVLIEGGVDYTIANTDSVSYKVYALGGVELFNNTGGTGWRASGGVKFNF